MADDYIPIENLKNEERKKKVRDFLQKAKEKGSAAYSSLQGYAKKGREYQLKASEKAKIYKEKTIRGVQKFNRGVENVNTFFGNNVPQARIKKSFPRTITKSAPPMQVLPNFSGGRRKQQDIFPMFGQPIRGKKGRKRNNDLFNFEF